MPTDLVSDDAEVRAILADPAYTVPPAVAVPPTQTDTLAWLRVLVARFSDGQEHDHRRALVERDLADLDPAALRRAAADLTADALASAGASREPFDAMTLARRVPVAALAAALGVSADAVPQAVDAVLAAASGYPNPDQAGPGADAGVGVLTRLLGPADADDPASPADPELLANRIGLLMQACDATAGLIGNALITAFAGPESEADDVVARTVRDDPPVLRTRRLSPGGEVITVDLSSCTFGAGRRPCPGADQATALAAGVLDAILPSCELADQQIDYLPSPNLRIPAELLITLTR